MRCIEDKQHVRHCCNKKLYGKLFVYFYGKTNNHNNKNNNNNDLTSHVCPNQQSRRGNDKHFNMKWMWVELKMRKKKIMCIFFQVRPVWFGDEFDGDGGIWIEKYVI